jgi:hypothetical protein
MTILSPGLVNRKGVERGNIDVSSTKIHNLSLSSQEREWSCICDLEISMFPLSTPFILTKPGERMIMYLCAKDIDVSSFYTFSIDLERGNIDMSSTQIHDHSLSWLGQ